MVGGRWWVVVVGGLFGGLLWRRIVGDEAMHFSVFRSVFVWAGVDRRVEVMEVMTECRISSIRYGIRFQVSGIVGYWVLG